MIHIPVLLRGSRETLTVDYRKNTGVQESGFDALVLPFPSEKCIGYPTVHAYFADMRATGYRRYCGFIQLIEQTGSFEESGSRQTALAVDGSAYSNRIGNPYFSYGYPANLYDAPCYNLGIYDRLTWRAYTYLVDMPSAMNGNRLGFMAGFTWGYIEDRSGPRGLLELSLLSETQWSEHYAYLIKTCPGLEG